MRTHNNVVDITNYVMMLTGQPLHAFDLNAFEEKSGKRSVAVRAAREGEVFRTLDDVERTLSAGMGLIATGEAGATPVALAGVMGGMESEVTDATVDVLVESACFNAGRTSHTSRDLALISDASIRFERQVDETGCVDVADIACALIEQLAGGKVAPGAWTSIPSQELAPISCVRSRARAVRRRDRASSSRALTRLGCRRGRGEGSSGSQSPRHVPPRPPREIDLIEEVLRLWGMGASRPPSPPPKTTSAASPASSAHPQGRSDPARLRPQRDHELSFAAPGDLERIGMTDEGRGCPVEIMNPLVAEQTEMRRSLIPGLLQSVEYNIKHSTANVQLYEIGTLFFGRENASAPKERESVAGVLSGSMGDVTWNHKPMPLRFFDGKGVVEELLSQLRTPKVRFRPADGDDYAFLQPGRGAEVLSGGTVLGWVGEIHPDARDVYGIDIPVVAFELNLEALIKGAGAQEAYREFSQFPSVEHDLAIVVDDDVTCEDLERRLRSAGGKLLVGVRLFDVYRDPVRVG
ncbi:MAG: phenylalanine--tRNA ligase subunit beta, partial [Collinsella intestinalis]